MSGPVRGARVAARAPAESGVPGLSSGSRTGPGELRKLG